LGDRLVLIIEDDEDGRDTLREALEDEGYRVLTASDGAEGLQVLQAQRPHLVLLDLFMPTMDGFTFLQSARAHAPLASIPIVALSAGGGSAGRSALQAGATRFVPKPIKLERLLEVVKELS
jgi:CheY-like chemotaxis protein